MLPLDELRSKLAADAAEIIGRIDAAGAELSAHVGLTAGRVRLAGFASAIGSLVPAALATLADRQSRLRQRPRSSHTGFMRRGTLICGQ